MRRTMHWPTIIFALTSIALVALSQPPSRYDKYGKVVKITTTEIDLEVAENGQLKVSTYVIANKEKFGLVKVGDMAKVRCYTDGKGIEVAETVTISGKTTSPRADSSDSPDPAAVSHTRPANELGAETADPKRLEQAAAASQTERQTEQMRERLKKQLNQILQTQETARGLIVNMSDVLFDFNKYTLKSEAREKLAKVSGILLAYPDLKLQVEGYTDDVGSDEYNQKLSQQRADEVRGYLVSQSLPDSNISAQGFGASQVIADNSTNSGRAQNRRVELVISGSSIGVQETAPGSQSPATGHPQM